MKDRVERALSIFLLSTCVAAPAIVNSQGLDEIIVTAQKRQQSLQDVPISVTAFSGEQAKNLGIDSTLDLALYTPGLTMGQNSGDGDFPFISIRGVSQRDFSDINESPSAVYIDEFYKANLIGLDQQIFDIDRVEVLRGPQGTLYGRNATGGLIHYITAKPSDEPGGYVELTVGEYDRVKLEGAIGGPLGETVSGRLSFLRHEHDGWVRNSVDGAEDGNALESTSVRGQLLFEPSETFSVGLMFQRSENDNEAGNMFQHVSADDPPPTFRSIPNIGQPGFAGFLEPTPDDLRDTHSNRDIFLETEQTTFIGRVEWSVNDLDFVSVTGWEETSKDATFDSDGTPFERGTEVHPEGEQISQELRVSGESGSVTWLAGIYYIDYDVTGSQSRCSPGSCATNRMPVQYALSTDSLAVFGNLDYAFSDQLSLTLGLRYTDEQKDYSLNNLDTGLVFNASTVGDLAKLDESNVDFNVRLNWTPSDDILIFGGVSRAHKAGLFNLGFTARANAIPGIPVDSETLTAYELGLKSDFMDGRGRLNGAIFYYDYKDSQAFQFDGTTLSAQAFNSDAEIAGAELELSITPVEGLNLIANLTFMDAELQDVVLFGLQEVDSKMPLTPDLQGSLIARYEWPVWGGRLAIQGDLSWFDDQYFDSFNSPSHFEDSYSIANVRAIWFSDDDKWRISVFGENIADEEYRTFSFDLAFLGFSTDVYGKPSWYGASVGYNF
jgi:iron complex outermembrane receptor protein